MYHQCNSLIHLPDAAPTEIFKNGRRYLNCNLTKTPVSNTDLYLACTSKLHFVVPWMECPEARSSRPGKGSPDICRSAIPGNGSSSAAARSGPTFFKTK